MRNVALMKRMANTDIGYTADQIDALLKSGSLERLGMGSRRACYRLPGVDLCVKCYRSDEEIAEGKYPGDKHNIPLSSSVVREIRRCRLDGKRNTCCQEYEYWKELRDRLPEDLMSVFPTTMEKLFVPSRGWCVVEELVTDADGTPTQLFADVWRNLTDGPARCRLLDRFRYLADDLVRHAVRFFDPQNILVQKCKGGELRLRITDFEPISRVAVPIEKFFPTLIRHKIRRRFGRYLDQFVGAYANDSPISISFCVNDAYAQHLAVVIASVLVNNPNSRFVFHVLHRDISKESQACVKELECMYPHCEVRFHEIDSSRFDRFKIPPELEHVTQETYYRYILPDVLGHEDRTIYSDVDVLCVGDLRPLWEINMQGALIAAVSEGAAGDFKKDLLNMKGSDPYFYAGLLVMDLAALRNGHYPQKLMENTLQLADKLIWPDQDVINITMRGRILQLSSEWDGINVRYSPFRKGIVIWHFPGLLLKPWCNIWKNTTWPIYLKYLLRSPYRRNATRFVLGHIKGFFFFKYTKKQVTRYLVCGIRVWKKSTTHRACGQDGVAGGNK